MTGGILWLYFFREPSIGKSKFESQSQDCERVSTSSVGARNSFCVLTVPSGTGAKFHHPRDSGNWFEMDLKLEILKRWRQNAASSYKTVCFQFEKCYSHSARCLLGVLQ